MGSAHIHALGFHHLQRYFSFCVCTLCLVLFGSLASARGLHAECDDDSHLGRFQWRIGFERAFALARLGRHGAHGGLNCQCALAHRK